MDKISNVTVKRGAPPLILAEDGFSMDHAAGEATLSVDTISNGYQYRLMRSDDLSSWQPVTPPSPDGWIDGTGTTLSIADDEAAGAERRFYKIEMRVKPE